jgi:hypothetical protein
LVTVRLPQQLAKLSRYAFYKCRKLVLIRIPDSLCIIEPYAFYGCRAMRNVFFSERSRVKVIGAWAFSSLWSLTAIALPESLRTISQFAFMQDWALASVIFPSRLREIREMSFWNCSKLANLILLPKSVHLVEGQPFEKSMIGSVAFASCDLNITAESLPKSVACIIAPKRCEAQFVQLFGKIVKVRCPGFTGAEQNQSGLVSVILFIGTCAFLSWKAWDALRSLKPDLLTETAPLLTKPGRDEYRPKIFHLNCIGSVSFVRQPPAKWSSMRWLKTQAHAAGQGKQGLATQPRTHFPDMDRRVEKEESVHGAFLL